MAKSKEDYLAEGRELFKLGKPCPGAPFKSWQQRAVHEGYTMAREDAADEAALPKAKVIAEFKKVTGPSKVVRDIMKAQKAFFLRYERRERLRRA